MKFKEMLTSSAQKFTQYYKDHKKRTIAIGSGVLVIIILLVTILGGGNKQQSSATQILTLSTGNFSKTIDIVGNVKAVPSAAITWGTSGTVGDVYYNVGDSISEGTVIAKLADSSVSASILEAQSDLLSAQYELDRVMNSDSDFQTAAQALEDAEYDYRAKKDARDYWNFNGTDQALIDQARSAYHTADNEVWNLQKQYDAMVADDPDRENANTTLQDAILVRDKALRNLNYLLGHSYDHSVETDYIEYDMAAATLEEARITYQRYLDNSDEVAAAQAKVQALENTVNSASIIAPFDGVITDISANAGESVTSGETAVQLDNLNNLVIEVSVSEVDVNDIEIGQPVNITFDAIPNKEYQGMVTGISQAGDDSSGIVEFKVSITVTNPDDEIKPRFTAVASIIVQEIENAVLVPNLAIQSLNGNSIVMVVADDGSITPTPVEVEASGDSYSVLKNSTLKEGDQVVVQLDLASISDFAGGFGGAMFMGGGEMRVNRASDQQPPQQ
ncbi:MAG: efflux RND transporter periplasmic adaptor subunit [Chloroflexi bacterium]|nr:efflux RND transporter periplasmic adaptor subunit [Chloroflexota bacterium]